MRRPIWLWPTAVTACYLLVVVLIFFLEYVSEQSKISRGTYTDTFSPYLFSHLLTLPMSAAHNEWGGYPARFDPTQFRHLARAAVEPTVINIVVEAVLVLLIALSTAYGYRRATGRGRMSQ